MNEDSCTSNMTPRRRGGHDAALTAQKTTEQISLYGRRFECVEM